MSIPSRGKEERSCHFSLFHQVDPREIYLITFPLISCNGADRSILRVGKEKKMEKKNKRERERERDYAFKQKLVKYFFLIFLSHHVYEDFTSLKSVYDTVHEHTWELFYLIIVICQTRMCHRKEVPQIVQRVIILANFKACLASICQIHKAKLVNNNIISPISLFPLKLLKSLILDINIFPWYLYHLLY